MAERQLARRADASGSVEDWMPRRTAEAKLRGAAEAAAHEALGRSARTGDPIRAPTSADVRALGARIIEERNAKSSSPPLRQPPDSGPARPNSLLQEGADQAL